MSTRCKYLFDQPKGLTVNQKFLLVMRLLRANFPLLYPVKVRRVKSSDRTLMKMNANGYCHLVNSHKPKDKRYFVIAINANQSWEQIMEDLMHEYSHCMTWEIASKNDHGRASWESLV
jgi:hypothetical protein